eukprot:1158439-Pelagomonas_calceolata.AAC.4
MPVNSHKSHKMNAIQLKSCTQIWNHISTPVSNPFTDHCMSALGHFNHQYAAHFYDFVTCKRWYRNENLGTNKKFLRRWVTMEDASHNK